MKNKFYSDNQKQNFNREVSDINEEKIGDLNNSSESLNNNTSVSLISVSTVEMQGVGEHAECLPRLKTAKKDIDDNSCSNEAQSVENIDVGCQQSSGIISYIYDKVSDAGSKVICKAVEPCSTNDNEIIENDELLIKNGTIVGNDVIEEDNSVMKNNQEDLLNEENIMINEETEKKTATENVVNEAEMASAVSENTSNHIRDVSNSLINENRQIVNQEEENDNLIKLNDDLELLKKNIFSEKKIIETEEVEAKMWSDKIKNAGKSPEIHITQEEISKLAMEGKNIILFERNDEVEESIESLESNDRFDDLYVSSQIIDGKSKIVQESVSNNYIDVQDKSEQVNNLTEKQKDLGEEYPKNCSSSFSSSIKKPICEKPKLNHLGWIYQFEDTDDSDSSSESEDFVLTKPNILEQIYQESQIKKSSNLSSIRSQTSYSNSKKTTISSNAPLPTKARKGKCC